MVPTSVEGETHQKSQEESTPGEQADGRKVQLTQRPQMVVEDDSDASRFSTLPEQGQPGSQGAAAHHAGHRAERELCPWAPAAALESATPSCVWHVERVDSVDGETLEQMEADAGEAKVRRNAWSVGAEAAAVERLRLRLEGGVRRDRLWGTYTIERLIEALAAATEGLGLAAQRLAVYEAEEKARVQQEEPSQEGGGGAESTGTCEPAQAPAACGHSCPREETEEPAWLTEAGHVLAAGRPHVRERCWGVHPGLGEEGPAAGEWRCRAEGAERVEAGAISAVPGVPAEAFAEDEPTTWGGKEVTPEKAHPLASAPGVRVELASLPAARRRLHVDPVATGEFPFLLHLEARFSLPGRILRDLVATQLQCAARVVQAKRLLEGLRRERMLQWQVEAEVAAVVRLQQAARGVSARHACERARLKRRQAEARVRLTAREAEVRAESRRVAACTTRASRVQVDSRLVKGKKGQSRQEREAVRRREVQVPPPRFGMAPGAAGKAFCFTRQEGAAAAPVFGQGGAVIWRFGG